MNEAVRWYAPPLEEPPPPAEDVPVELPRPPSLEEIQQIRDDAQREGYDAGLAQGRAEGLAASDQVEECRAVHESIVAHSYACCKTM